jgi:hypothetical protein
MHTPMHPRTACGSAPSGPAAGGYCFDTAKQHGRIRQPQPGVTPGAATTSSCAAHAAESLQAWSGPAAEAAPCHPARRTLDQWRQPASRTDTATRGEANATWHALSTNLRDYGKVTLFMVPAAHWAPAAAFAKWNNQIQLPRCECTTSWQ